TAGLGGLAGPAEAYGGLPAQAALHGTVGTTMGLQLPGILKEAGEAFNRGDISGGIEQTLNSAAAIGAMGALVKLNAVPSQVFKDIPLTQRELAQQEIGRRLEGTAETLKAIEKQISGKPETAPIEEAPPQPAGRPEQVAHPAES